MVYTEEHIRMAFNEGIKSTRFNAHRDGSEFSNVEEFIQSLTKNIDEEPEPTIAGTLTQTQGFQDGYYCYEGEPVYETRDRYFLVFKNIVDTTKPEIKKYYYKDSFTAIKK